MNKHFQPKYLPLHAKSKSFIKSNDCLVPKDNNAVLGALFCRTRYNKFHLNFKTNTAMYPQFEFQEIQTIEQFNNG